MYNDLKQTYYWSRMKCDIPEFIPKCLVCEQVKAKHQSGNGNELRWISVYYSLKKLADLYVAKVVRLHGVPLSIISDCEPRFTSRFCGKLHEALGTNLNFSTTFILGQKENQNK
ncbi:integrase [Gossypium australe]|uniref:Integrase n=1 Tax=Gossypium australe TaxID=47621 RepID=A0A5B6VLA6_9ROSI|nr:integrase [Gossypium australe]